MIGEFLTFFEVETLIFTRKIICFFLFIKRVFSNHINSPFRFSSIMRKKKVNYAFFFVILRARPTTKPTKAGTIQPIPRSNSGNFDPTLKIASALIAV